MLTGSVGRVDGTGMHDATLNIYGDGNLLHTQELRAGDLPAPISVYIEGVRLLRVEFVIALGDTTYALAGVLE
jgi:hypothetical protein